MAMNMIRNSSPAAARISRSFRTGMPYPSTSLAELDDAAHGASLSAEAVRWGLRERVPLLDPFSTTLARVAAARRRSGEPGHREQRSGRGHADSRARRHRQAAEGQGFRECRPAADGRSLHGLGRESVRSVDQRAAPLCRRPLRHLRESGRERGRPGWRYLTGTTAIPPDRFRTWYPSTPRTVATWLDNAPEAQTTRIGRSVGSFSRFHGLATSA